MFNEKRKLINNELFTDYKAAAMAADLVERGLIDINDVEIIPIGADKRAYGKEIEKSLPYFSEKRLRNRIQIESNREGLYDMLPEGLFHKPPRGSSGMDEEGMIKDVRERREEEKQARTFFRPFDVEFNHMRMITELYENRLDKKTTYNDLNQIFACSWEEFSFLNKEQSIIWMHLLPEIQQKRNDINFISHVLTALFNIPISLIDTSEAIKPTTIGTELQMELGKSDLGINTIIGNDFMPDHDQLSIEIGPTTAADLVGFMPGQKNRRIMDMAIEYLIPIETEVNISMITDDRFKETLLIENAPNVYLGYTVYL